MKKTVLMLAAVTALFAGVPAASAAPACGYDNACSYGYGDTEDEGGYGTQAPGYGGSNTDKDVYGA